MPKFNGKTIVPVVLTPQEALFIRGLLDSEHEREYTNYCEGADAEWDCGRQDHFYMEKESQMEWIDHIRKRFPAELDAGEPVFDK